MEPEPPGSVEGRRRKNLEVHLMRKLIIATTALAFLSSTAFVPPTAFVHSTAFAQDKPGGAPASTAEAARLDKLEKDLTATKEWTTAQLRTCLNTGQCYQAPYDLLRSQAYYQLDLRVSKEIRLGDTPRLKLMFQGFDLTNRANFGNKYVGDVRNTNFQQPNGYITPSGVIVPRSFSGEIGAQFIF